MSTSYRFLLSVSPHTKFLTPIIRVAPTYIAVTNTPRALVLALIGGDLPPSGAGAYFDDFVAIF